MACYTVGEDLPAELKDGECIEDAETSRDHGKKTLARSLESYERRPITARRMLSSAPWRMGPTSRDDRCDDMAQHPYPFTMVSGIGTTDRLLRRRDVSSRNCSM